MFGVQEVEIITCCSLISPSETTGLFLMVASIQAAVFMVMLIIMSSYG